MAPRILLAIPFALGLAACDASQPEPPEEVRVRVRTVALDPVAGAPVVLLEEENGTRQLPIWIGFNEARSIASEMEQRKEPRPNTHDLAKRVIDGLHASVERVVVTELRDRTFYALLVLRTPDGRVEIDARPSDAIAIALRFQAPLYVRASVFETSQQLPDEEAFEQHAALSALRQASGS